MRSPTEHPFRGRGVREDGDSRCGPNGLDLVNIGKQQSMEGVREGDSRNSSVNCPLGSLGPCSRSRLDSLICWVIEGIGRCCYVGDSTVDRVDIGRDTALTAR
jgi:hypothetical protein